MRDMADDENHDWKPTPGASRTAILKLDTFIALLKAMGMRIFVAPIKSPAKPTRRRVAERAA